MLLLPGHSAGLNTRPNYTKTQGHDTMTNELWPSGPRFIDAKGVFRLGTDSVLLAHFIKPKRVKTRAIDLGCGAGIISVLLAWDNQSISIDGVEIDPRAAQLAVKNAQLSGLSGQIRIIEGDLRNHRELLTAGAYDLCVCNPPYYAQGRGKRSENLSAARGEETCSLFDVCRAAGYLTRWGGSFALVHKPERLSEIFGALSAHGLEPKRMRFVQHMSASPPSLVLIESRRGGNPSLTVEAPLILANSDGTDSDEVKVIYRRD